MSRELPLDHNNVTGPLPFLFGRYHTSGSIIPYFQVVLTFDEASMYINPVREMPEFNEQEWRIEELYQRDVDLKRVQNDILPYLQGNNPQFFSAITVALLPFKNNKLTNFTDAQWSPYEFHPLSTAVDNPQRYLGGCQSRYFFGPLTAEYFNDKPPTDQREGRLYWNKKELFAVAIDGQHRLEAIKGLVAARKNDTRLQESRIPVILIVLDPQLGYQHTESDSGKGDILKSIRRIFIDLNKHAKSVDRPRQILLDDFDPTALCVRSLIANKIQSGYEQLDSKDSPLIPLSLVDWHSNSAKFDSGPYITSLLNLDFCVQKAIGVQWGVNSTGYSTARKKLKSLKKLLDGPSSLNTEIDSIISRINSHEGEQVPFQLRNAECRTLSRQFYSTFSRALCHFLHSLAPYNKLIRDRSDNDGFSVFFINFMASYLQGKNAGVTDTRSDKVSEDDQVRFKSILENINKLKSGPTLAFTVVFQKACFLSIFKDLEFVDSFDPRRGTTSAMVMKELTLNELYPGIDNDLELPQNKSDLYLMRSKALVKTLNRLYNNTSQSIYRVDSKISLQGSKKYLWLGSFTKTGIETDHSDAAAMRASWILSLSVSMCLFKDITKAPFEDYIAFVKTNESNSSRVRALMKRATNHDGQSKGLTHFILNSEDSNRDKYTDKQHSNALESRLEYLYDHL